MRPAPRNRAPRGAARWAPPLILAALGLIPFGPATAEAQQDGVAPSPAGQDEGKPPAGSVEPTDDPLTFLDSVTVSATLRPAPVRETPGMVSVIDSQSIEERLVRDFADLVKYEPGVYIENNVTRLGLNGFNIRGIGGNRVMTQVDGVQTSEQFDFGPFNVHQVGLDVDALKTVEIVRSANSALYGSDALGGVVSLFTKDPADYLDGQGVHLGAKTTWDGRSDAVSANLALAAGTERLQGSLFASVHRGNEIRNQGTVETADDTRTAPNPQDIEGTQLLAKLVFTPSPGNMLRTTAEVYDTRVETEWFSDRGLLDFGRFQYHTADSDAVDTQDRSRVSVDHTLVDRGLDQLSWRLYGQFNDTSQVIDRERMTFGFGPPFPSLRHGTLDFEQVARGNRRARERRGQGGEMETRSRTRLPLALVIALVPGWVDAQGILLLAHGGRDDWNRQVLELASAVDASRPVEVAFGMANKRTIQDALDRLSERGVNEVVAVPLFISSHSSVMRATEYLLGSRDEAPPQLEAFARMGARRAADRAADDSDFDWTTPIEAAVPISVTTALDGHALVAEILLSRALDVSERPEEEVVVVVAHGPTSDEDNYLWLENMDILVERMRPRTRFSRIECLTVRDDASDPVRERATAELRAVVDRVSQEGKSALIVPLLLSYGGIEVGIRRRLEGLPYRMADQALLPDERLSEWVRIQATVQ